MRDFHLFGTKLHAAVEDRELCLKILCVDHDEKTGSHLAQTFAAQGFVVHSVHDTLSAIEELERHLDFNLMVCSYHLDGGTAAPIFWHLSVNNYSLASIIYSIESDENIKAQINYPDVISVIQKPDVSRLCECVQNFAAVLKRATKST